MKKKTAILLAFTIGTMIGTAWSHQPKDTPSSQNTSGECTKEWTGGTSQ